MAKQSLGEVEWCGDGMWDQNWNEMTDEIVAVKVEVPQIWFEGLIHAGQSVFLSGGQSAGQVEKLLLNDSGQVSYLIIHTARLWGRHKLLPTALVNDVNPKGVWLSIDHNTLDELADAKTDEALAGEVESVLWKDEMLRLTDYQGVHVHVKNGVVSLTGHILGMMSLTRIKSAIEPVKGIRGMRLHLVADDRLLLKVTTALVAIKQAEGNPIFAKVQNGVVVLSGEMISAETRDLAEQCAANIPWVRGVINHTVAPGVDPDAEDQRFLQPAIGVKVFFRDGLFGLVQQVVINPKNRRVVSMILRGQFPDAQHKSGSMPERLIVIPVCTIRYLTGESGFLLIESKETTQYQNFDPAGFAAPEADWIPPYPYCIDAVKFAVK